MPPQRPNARLPMVLRRSSIPGLGLLLSLAPVMLAIAHAELNSRRPAAEEYPQGE